MTDTNFRVFLNSLPKAGTNLVSRAFDLAGLQYDRVGLASTLLLGPHYLTRQLLRRSLFERDPIIIGLAVQMPVRRAWLSRRLSRVPVQSYVTGHANWSIGLENLLAAHNYRSALVIRNPIDVLASQCHYVARSESHYLHQTHASRDLAERIEIALSGGRFQGLDVAPFHAMLERVDGWIGRPGVEVIRFEDIVGPDGGGTAERQRRAFDALSSLTGRLFDQAKMAAELYGKSHTFRKGQIGSAAEELGPDILARVDVTLGPIRQKWGYADG